MSIYDNDREDGWDSSQYPSAAEVRAWGIEINPRAVGDRGRLPWPLIVAWNRAHPTRPYVHAERSHGTTTGYQRDGCRCERCLNVGRRDRRVRAQFRAEEHWEEAFTADS